MLDDDNNGQWIDIFFGNSSLVMEYWTIYLAVIGVLITLLGVSVGSWAPMQRKLACFSFILFVPSNIIPMYSAQESVWIASQKIGHTPYGEAKFAAINPDYLLVFHIFVDIFVILLILIWGGGRKNWKN